MKLIYGTTKKQHLLIRVELNSKCIAGVSIYLNHRIVNKKQKKRKELISLSLSELPLINEIKIVIIIIT